MRLSDAYCRDFILFGHFHDRFGNAAVLHFDHIASQLGGQLEVIDQMPLLGQPDPARRFARRLYIQQKPVAMVVVGEPGGFTDDVTRRLLITAMPLLSGPVHAVAEYVGV